MLAEQLKVNDKVRVCIWGPQGILITDTLNRDETLENIHAACAIALKIHPDEFELDVTKTGYYTAGKTLGDWGRKILHINYTAKTCKKIKVDLDPIEIDESDLVEVTE